VLKAFSLWNCPFIKLFTFIIMDYVQKVNVKSIAVYVKMTLIYTLEEK